jgi:ATPase subunit of ABC transporter with duplicated ATPase domains
MPASLRAQRLGFAFDPSRPLFDGLTFHLSPGWTGLVGANGAGKTTLLRLIRGELTPGSGALLLEPPGARVAWCPQRVEARDDLIDGLAWAVDRLARRLHGQLHLDPATLERWPTLSPGERKRWQLGAALWSEPDVLLLDEPGNHLDVEALAWMKQALREHRGIGVLVSHDRALLDELTTATLRVLEGDARLWPQPFSAARALWLEEEHAARELQRDTKRRLEKEEQKLDARRRALTAASKQRSTGARMKSKYDSDARTLAADFRAEQAERSLAATLRRVDRQAEGLRTALDAVKVRDDAGQALFLKYERCPKSTVVQFRGNVRAGDVVLLRDFSLQLAREGRVWLRGPNGAGKSSALQAVLAGCAVPEERRLVLPQELTAEDALDDLATVKALAPDARGRVMQLVHALGVEPDHLLRSAAPSPGEARKLRLALGLGRHAWLAVLDEPTNHLDLPAIERLEAALVAFPGALLLVTHDQRLGSAVGAEPLELAG